MRKPRYSAYAERALRERPTHTKGGKPVEIVEHNGHVYAHTLTGKGGTYTSSDFPTLFGWPRTGRQTAPAPLTLTHKGHKYLRLPRLLK